MTEPQIFLHAIYCECEECSNFREIRQLEHQLQNQRNARKELREIAQEL